LKEVHSGSADFEKWKAVGGDARGERMITLEWFIKRQQRQHPECRMAITRIVMSQLVSRIFYLKERPP
jgi:hypothetical protein